MDERELLIQAINTQIDRIRAEHKKKYGIRSAIVDDSFAEKMADNPPKSVEDILPYVRISSKKVKTEYAESFMKVISENLPDGFSPKPTDSVSMEKYKEIISKLSDKLSDFSKSNNLLYLGKLGKLREDVSDKVRDADILNMNVALCDRIASKDEEARYGKLMLIDHDSRSKKRDHGQNSLYVGYLFLESNIPGSKFPVRAPLVLIPVVIARESTSACLCRDVTRDVIFNENLAMFHQQKTGFEMDQSKGRPSCVLSDILEEGNPGMAAVKKAVCDYYGKFGMELSIGNTAPVAFTDVTAEDYSKSVGSDMSVIPYAVLGTFECPNQSIKQDFDKIMAKDNIPHVITELIKGSGNAGDIYRVTASKSCNDDISEKDLDYINYLNSSQENIIHALETEDTLVIQGPPGTGKSQTITEIIASWVLKNRSVLVVTEKKVALEVIKNRLGKLGHIALMIDDPSDKESFYKQMEFAISKHDDPGLKDSSKEAAEIDADVAKLSAIYAALYQVDEKLGVEPYKLYLLGRHFNLKDNADAERYRRVHKLIPQSSAALGFDELAKIHNDMNNDNTRKIVYDYLSLESAYPWVSGIKPGLSEREISDMVKELLELKQNSGVKKGLFKKISGNVSQKRDFSKKYLSDSSIYDALINAEDVDEIASVCSRHNVVALAYNNENPLLRDYAKAVFEASEGILEKAGDANEDVFYAIIASHLEQFEKDNAAIRGIMNGYESMLEKIERRTTARMDITRNNVEHALYEHLYRLLPSVPDIKMVLERPNRYSVSKFVQRIPLFDSFKVWLMTPESVSTILPLKQGMFDVVIFDEASQMYLERGIPAIYRGKKVVISGDDKQLRPSSLGSSRITFEEDADDVDDLVDVALEQESLLDLARFRYTNYVLNFHYRSKYEELIAFSNRTFYRGELFVSPNVSVPSEPPIEYHNVGGVWDHQKNREEAVAIVDWIQNFLRTRKKKQTLGVITFNSEQREEIIDLLLSRKDENGEPDSNIAMELKRIEDGEDKSLFVKNIENVQGDERDVILFSIGYAKNSDSRMFKRFGWLNTKGGENRLNVAVTRAKQKIHIFASLEPSEFNVDETKNEGPKILKSYLEYAKAVSDRNEEEIVRILSRNSGSVLETKPNRAVDDLYKFLASNGYSLRRNVGISGYQIDLVVSDTKGFIIGIESDTTVYPGKPSTRERDIHRTRYLKARGWKICRFWTSEYWSNRDGEFDRILSMVKKAAENR